MQSRKGGLLFTTALLSMCLLVGGQIARASIITYDFTTGDGISGSFSYDDTTTTTVAQPPAIVSGAVWYPAISFVVNGSNIASPLIGIFNNVDVSGTSIDSIEVTGAVLGGNGPSIELATTDLTLFSTSALSEADGRTLSDFAAAFIADNGLHDFSSLVESSSSIPEPATLALLGIALAGIGVARRSNRIR